MKPSLSPLLEPPIQMLSLIHILGIERPFWMGEAEVTLEQYRRFDPEYANGWYDICLLYTSRADEMFTILMGDVVEPRKNYIVDHALNVRNLDI